MELGVDYFQENLKPEKRDEEYTNRGLMACSGDGLPVGVMCQTRPKPGVRYHVLGVAPVEYWHRGLPAPREHETGALEDKINLRPASLVRTQTGCNIGHVEQTHDLESKGLKGEPCDVAVFMDKLCENVRKGLA